MAKMDKALQNIYYSENGGGSYQSFARFAQAVKTAGLSGLSRAELEDYYQRQTLVQLTHSRRRPRLFRHFRFHGAKRCLGIDAMYITKSGRSRIRYAYVGMNMMTRKCALFFTTRLAAKNVTAALLRFVKELEIDTGQHPLLISDRGSELRSREFQHVLRQNNFTHYFPSRLSASHVSAVERVIRTLRGIASKILRTPLEIAGRRKTMCDALEQAVKIYNATPNVTGFSPNSIRSDSDYFGYVWERERLRARELDAHLVRLPHHHSLPVQPTLKIGTLVRKQLAGLDWEHETRPHAFRKEHDRPKFSTTVYRVEAIHPSSPVISYLLTSLDGRLVPGSFTSDQLLAIPN